MTFISSTIGFQGVRIQFHDHKDGVKLVPVCMHNLQTIRDIKQIVITTAEYNDRDFEYDDDFAEWNWAVEKLDIFKSNEESEEK